MAARGPIGPQDTIDTARMDRSENTRQDSRLATNQPTPRALYSRTILHYEESTCRSQLRGCPLSSLPRAPCRCPYAAQHADERHSASTRTPPSCYLRATGGPPGGRARRSPKPAESTTHRITTQPHRRHTRMESRHSHTSRPRAAGNWPTYPSPTSSAYCIPPRRWALARACGAAIAAAAAAAGASSLFHPCQLLPA